MSNIRKIPFSVFVFVFIYASADSFAQNADEAIELLKEGNVRFVAMKMQHPNIGTVRREAIAAAGQKPFAMVLGCSDSRVPVEIIFDCGIGDIFVVRVAGNVVLGPAVTGSAEYAAEHLGVPVLIVMGHTECGAGKAAISAAPLDGNMREITGRIQSVVAGVKTERPDLEGAALENAVIKANILQGKIDLLSMSEGIKRLAGQGKLKILTALYDIKSGAVEWIDGE